MRRPDRAYDCEGRSSLLTSAIVRWVRNTLMLLVCGVSAPAIAFQSGSPACDVDVATMASTHAGAQNQNLGVSLDIPQSFVPGDPTTVALNGVGTFTGLLLIAENTASQRIGIFTIDPGFKAIACGSAPAATVTHGSNAAKALPKAFTWTAPADASEVRFRGIVFRSSPLHQYQMLAPVTATAAIPVPILSTPWIVLLVSVLVLGAALLPRRARPSSGV